MNSASSSITSGFQQSMSKISRTNILPDRPNLNSNLKFAHLTLSIHLTLSSMAHLLTSPDHNLKIWDFDLIRLDSKVLGMKSTRTKLGIMSKPDWLISKNQNIDFAFINEIYLIPFMICEPRMQISPDSFLGKEAPVSWSMILSSAFRTTVPHEPDLISNGSFAKAKLMDSTGPASVIPYPCVWYINIKN